MEHIIRQTRFMQTKNRDLFDFKAILSPNNLLVIELHFEFEFATALKRRAIV